MKNIKFYVYALLIAKCMHVSAEKDVMLEFKAAYFQPINCTFKHIYGGGAIFGPEVTFKLFRAVHGFVSVDYFTKKGYSIGLDTPTKVNFLPIGVGLKFMGCVSDHARLYAGLGFQPTYLRVNNCSPYVVQHQKKWGFGGIAKFGAYIDLGCHAVLDLFADYSFVKVTSSCCSNASLGYVQATTSDLSGFIFGAGLGYRFN